MEWGSKEAHFVIGIMLEKLRNEWKKEKEEKSRIQDF